MEFILTDEEKSQITTNERHRKDCVQWVSGIADWKWLLTLTFRFDVTESQAESALKKWQSMMNRQFFPRGSGREIKMYPALETTPTSGRYHWHILIGDVSGSSLKKSMKGNERFMRYWIVKKWQKISTAGDFYKNDEKDWLEEVDPSSIEYLSGYLFKQHTKNNKTISPQHISV